MNSASIRPSRLLVSVRNATEARAAIDGGCDILDVKEPARGSLGMADAAVIHDIAAIANEVPVSAALGETRDWLRLETVRALPRKLSYCKLGSAGITEEGDWRASWLSVRMRFEAASGRPLNWIAVAYADWESAAAASPLDVLAAAVEPFSVGNSLREFRDSRSESSTLKTNCVGLLIDTYAKHGRSSFALLGEGAVRELVESAKRAGLLTAVAGLCTLDDVHRAAELSPDIIAVRTLACENARRQNPICSDAVRRLCNVLHQSPITNHQ